MVQRGLQVHGWVYDVSNGRIKPLDVVEDVSHAHYQVKVSDDELD